MHDQHAREHAKRLYRQHGAAYAAEHTGIPERTIRRWALAEGWPQRMTVVAGRTLEQTGRPVKRSFSAGTPGGGSWPTSSGTSVASS
jgi:transposase